MTPVQESALIELRRHLCGKSARWVRVLDALRDERDALAAKLERDADRKICGWCDDRKPCRRPPRGGVWQRDPICRPCYLRACEVDKIAKPVPWSKLRRYAR